ncbi:hypothetical protein GW17_00039044 [Ensete ventricosum]|nr:hypothetical protein GW17_00039044 [Ensete ventricosum]RZR76545.1 hypothetical protein BHM03_00001385 [Ensete ventricosum]
MLGEQVQAQDLVPPVHVEENDMVEKYSIPEVPQQLPQPDERIDDSPADDTASYPSGLDTTREPPPATPEEPVGEPTRQTYASISCSCELQESDVFYAFIEYEDAIGVQNALKVCHFSGRLNLN